MYSKQSIILSIKQIPIPILVILEVKKQTFGCSTPPLYATKNFIGSTGHLSVLRYGLVGL